MKRNAFTLVELLVVVAIIALLVILFLPQLSTIRGISRDTSCRNNLHQISQAFQIAQSKALVANQALACMPYPGAAAWPNTPYQDCPTSGIYLCPADPSFSDGSVGSVAGSNGSGSGTGGTGGTGSGTSVGGTNGVDTGADVSVDGLEFMSQEGWSVPFAKGTRCYPTVGDGYIDFAFSDQSIATDYDHTNNDVLTRLYTSENPPRLEVTKNTGVGYTRNAIYYYEVLKIADAAHMAHASFTLSSGSSSSSSGGGGGGNGYGQAYFGIHGLPGYNQYGLTNYGFNANLQGMDISPGCIVLTDYTKRVADPTASDFGANLTSAAASRHRGKVNVLLADKSVRPFSATALQVDPTYWAP
jgi:prepilin-type N-terminal cleavage/methylation domain-containing protein